MIHFVISTYHVHNKFLLFFYHFEFEYSPIKFFKKYILYFSKYKPLILFLFIFLANSLRFIFGTNEQSFLRRPKINHGKSFMELRAKICSIFTKLCNFLLSVIIWHRYRFQQRFCVVVNFIGHWPFIASWLDENYQRQLIRTRRKYIIYIFYVILYIVFCLTLFKLVSHF